MWKRMIPNLVFMTSKVYQATEEKDVLTSLIVNDRVLSSVCQRIGKRDGSFGQRWFDLIFKWCFEYHTKYHRAPGRAIEPLFVDWAQSSKDKDSMEIIESLLSSLTRNYKRGRADLTNK